MARCHLQTAPPMSAAAAHQGALTARINSSMIDPGGIPTQLTPEHAAWWAGACPSRPLENAATHCLSDCMMCARIDRIFGRRRGILIAREATNSGSRRVRVWRALTEGKEGRVLATEFVSRQEPPIGIPQIQGGVCKACHRLNCTPTLQGGSPSHRPSPSPYITLCSDAPLCLAPTGEFIGAAAAHISPGGPTRQSMAHASTPALTCTQRSTTLLAVAPGSCAWLEQSASGRASAACTAPPPERRGGGEGRWAQSPTCLRGLGLAFPPFPGSNGGVPHTVGKLSTRQMRLCDYCDRHNISPRAICPCRVQQRR
jgi:hypothetical protein